MRVERYLQASPVAAVLCAVASDPNCEGDGVALAEGLARMTDWNRLSETATRHGMAGLLTRSATCQSQGIVPAEVLSRWRELAVATAVRSFRMQRELVRVIAALEAQGIRVLAFKGPMLAEQVYGDPGIRHFYDLDLLISPSDFPAFRGGILEVGYRDSYRSLEIPDDVLIRSEAEASFEHPGANAAIDVHWRFGHRFAEDSMPAEGLLDRGEEVSILGQSILGLSAADLTQAVALHGWAHGWQRLEEVAALGHAMRNTEADALEKVLSLARTHRCRDRLALSMLVADGMGVSCGSWEAAVGSAAGRRLRRLAAQACGGLAQNLAFGSREPETSAARKARLVLWQARAMDGIVPRSRHAWKRLVVPSVRDGLTVGGRGSVGSFAVQLRRQGRLWRRRTRHE